MRKSLLVPIGAALLTLGVGSAHALGFNTAGYAGPVTVTSSWVGVTNHNYYGGPFTITPNGNDGAWPSYVPGSFVSYCVELIEDFNPNSNLTGYSIKGSTVQTDYQGGSPTYAPISSSQITMIGQLMTQSQTTFGANWNNATNGKVIQAAIWEIVYERSAGSNPDASPFTYADFDLGSGELMASGLDTTAKSTVSSMFDSNSSTYLGRGGFTYTPYAVLHSATQQDFITPVPEPEGYALAFAGLACIGLFGRKFRAAKKA